jgi:hypothetical protein
MPYREAADIVGSGTARGRCSTESTITAER